MAPTRIGLIGTGGVANLHADAIAAVDGLSLAGAVSRNPYNVERFVASHGGHGYKSIEALVGDDTIDLVSVCTTPDQHLTCAVQALRAGKHVIVEKPVGRSLDEIDILQRESERAGRLCVPCHNYVYAPALQRAKALLKDGRFGRVANFWLIYNQHHKPDIGVAGMALHELCVHHAYVTLYFLGRPASVISVSSNIQFTDPTADDQVMLVCKMPDGAIATSWGSFAADDRTGTPWTVVYKLIGTNGGFTYSWDDVVLGDAPQPGWDRVAYRDSFRYVYEHVARRCLPGHDAPLSTLADARDAHCLLDAAMQGAALAQPIDYR